MKRTRKGFTLVELLIVIVVIGILSAMMMLSSNEAVTTAKANNITSNLRNLKTAALAYYTDHIVEAESSSFDLTSDAVKEAIFGYLGGKTEIPDKADYSFVAKNGKWYVQCKIPKKVAGQDTIRKKVEGRSKSLGLLNANYEAYAPSKGDPKNEVLLRIR